MKLIFWRFEAISRDIHKKCSPPWTSAGGSLRLTDPLAADGFEIFRIPGPVVALEAGCYMCHMLCVNYI